MIILIIEDNKADFAFLKEYLKQIDWDDKLDIIHAKNMEEVVQLKADISPNLIFSDLGLPDSIGLDTFHAVSTLFPQSTIIVLSGIDDREIALHAIQAGAQDYLVKNEIEEKLLLKTIRYSIERKQIRMRLEESNMRYELVSMATNDPVWDWNLQTGEITWNRQVDIFGYPETVVKDGNWFRSCIHEEDSARVLAGLDACFAKLTDVWSDQYRFRCYNGSYKYLLNRGCIIRNGNGYPIRMIGTMQDVTQRTELQIRLDQERAENERDVLKATIDGQEKEKQNISKELHDNINQVLATAKMYLGFAIEKESLTTDLVSKAHELINQATDEIRKLTHTLSAASLAEDSFINAVKEMSHEITSSNAMSITVEEEVHVALRDKQKELALFRIVQEQINNIYKYAHAEHVSIRVSGSKDWVRLKITDDGVGFDPSVKNRGIGLRNMESRLNIYNGRMKVVSAPGRGCTLEVEMPI